jgi:CRP-like cAMP-binding protein
MNSEQLKNIEVLKQLDANSLERLASVLEEKEYADARTVFGENDPGDSMYFIARGRIHIEKSVQTGGGLRKVLAVLEEGDYFGEMALLDQKPRSAAAVASGKATVLRLSKAAFDNIQRENTAAGMGVLFAMIRTSSERIRRLSSHLVVYDEVGKAIGDARDLQELLEVILRQLSAAINADWGLLVLRSQFSDRLELRGQVNLSLNSNQVESIGEARGFLGLALADPQDRLIGRFSDHALFKSCERLGFESDSLLLSPINLETQRLGLIVLGGFQLDQFDLNDLNLSRRVARQAAQAILNARHREEQQARSRHSKQFVRF